MDWKTYFFTGFPQNGRGKRTDVVALTGSPPADIELE
jgi:hypothetical protein